MSAKVGQPLRAGLFGVGITFALAGTLAFTDGGLSAPSEREASLVMVKDDGKTVKTHPNIDGPVLTGPSVCRALHDGATTAQVRQALVSSGLSVTAAADIVAAAQTNYCP